MIPQIRLTNRSSLLAILCLSGALVGPVARAVIFSLDTTSNGGDNAYSVGPGVFGGNTTSWNLIARGQSPSNMALTDDTGAASTVTVSYTRTGSVGLAPTGTYGDLGASGVVSGNVSIGGLTPGISYDLAIFSGWDGTPSFTVGGNTETITPDYDWSSLTEGSQYVLFRTTANLSGVISFTPNANPGANSDASGWSAFQVTPSPVPEPSEYAFVFGALSLGAGVWLRRRRASQAA